MLDSRTMDTVLEVSDMFVSLKLRGRTVAAVESMSFRVGRGETLSIVGESGCGKSVTALAIMGLLDRSSFNRPTGRIELGGRDLLSLGEEELRSVRGRDIGMIFQEPMTSLNPMMTVGKQLAEPLMIHQGLSLRAALSGAEELLDKVHIPNPRARVNSYPHELSGGMRQRVMIAMAIACGPKLLIADEPTTALDVTVQARILDLIDELRTDLGTSVLLITHDLGVVSQYADRAIVMYAGRKVEEAPTGQLFAAPQHPYTQGLMQTVPTIEVALSHAVGEHRLREIEGIVPPLGRRPDTCRFADRCPFVFDRCRQEEPPLEQKAPSHAAACWKEFPGG